MGFIGLIGLRVFWWVYVGLSGLGFMGTCRFVGFGVLGIKDSSLLLVRDFS